mgnify:CR=1 FL=1
MIDASSRRLHRAFLDRTLAKEEWDHRAHLTVCWVTLDDRTPEAALGELRAAIRAYNEATGVANTATGGYHETITRYFVGAVADLRAPTIEHVLADDRCRRTAPFDHWSRELLLSTDARLNWRAPDVAPLPWGDPFTDRPSAHAPPQPA